MYEDADCEVRVHDYFVCSSPFTADTARDKAKVHEEKRDAN